MRRRRPKAGWLAASAASSSLYGPLILGVKRAEGYYTSPFKTAPLVVAATLPAICELRLLGLAVALQTAPPSHSANSRGISDRDHKSNNKASLSQQAGKNQ